MPPSSPDLSLMKTAYLTTYDSSDIHAWSGLGNYILRALQDAGLQTEPIGNLRDGQSPLLKLKELYYRKILSRQYLYDREPSVLINYAAQAEKQLSSIQHDVIFSPGTIPIAHLQTDKPIIFWTDATFAGIIDFYPSFSNLCAETIENGNKMEQLALSKCRIAIYSSEWAASSAIENYDVDPAKVKVVPYGANLQCDRDLQDIHQIIENKDYHCCNREHVILLGR